MIDTRKRRPQRRGELRRRRLLDAVCRLLEKRPLNALSLEDVARAARIPVASAYHFYPDRNALFAAAAHHYGQAIAAVLARPIPPRRVKRWEDIIDVGIERAMRFYRANPAARRLLTDPGCPAEIKLADRMNDRSLGLLIETGFAQHFVVPPLPDRSRIFFHAVEIADLMMLLSVMQSGRITRYMLQHARIACCAYLREFLGVRLPPRHGHRPPTVRRSAAPPRRRGRKVSTPRAR